MTRTKKIVLGLLLILLGATLARPNYHTMEIDGIERRFLISKPRKSSGPMPCLLVLHGGGGNARQMSRQGFSRLSRTRGFLVVYPEGLDKHWNDGRYDNESVISKREPNDVKFIDTLLTKLQDQYDIDPDRIFCTGVSNGAFMSHRLGLEISHRLAGIAPIIGGVNLTVKDKFPPENPLSVLIIQGVDDPIVPYKGGPVRLGKRGKSRGTLLSTDEAFSMWAKHNKCGKSKTQKLEEKADDGCTVELTRSSNGIGETEVLLYAMHGAGHTVPGGIQYLPERIIGKVCKDINAVDLVGEFCARNRRVAR